MKICKGFTLIELMVFIVVIGIVAAGVFSGLNMVLRKSNDPGKIMQASQLANARMNIIFEQRLVNGVASFTDPCAGGSPPSACTALSSFASGNGFTVNSTITPLSAGVRTATITVNPGNVTVYMRFVQ